MYVDESTLELLEQLQLADVVILQGQRKVEQLPQLKELAVLKEKKQQIKDKYSQVSRISSDSDKNLARINEEEALVRGKIATIQGNIDDASGDYRAVESLTKDLDGQRRRLDKLEAEHLEAEEKAEQIGKVQDQIDAALTVLVTREKAVKDSFDTEARAIAAKAATAKSERQALMTKIEPEVLKLYAAAVKRCGGVGLTHLTGNTCGACRTPLDDNRLLAVRRNAPLAECPNCHRLLIVEE